MAETQKRGGYRIEDDLHLPAEAKVRRIGTTLTDVVRQAYREFLAEDDQTSADRLGARLATGTPGHVLVQGDGER